MCCARPLSSGPWSVSDVSAATRTRVNTEKRVFHALSLAVGCSTSELFNTQATLTKLFVRGASRAVASRVEGLVCEQNTACSYRGSNTQMDALGFDVEETKGGNTRGSGYWEAPRKTPGEIGAAPADGVREVWFITGDSRYDAVRGRPQRRPDVPSVPEQRGAGGNGPSRGQTESSFKGDSRSAMRLVVKLST